MQEILLLIKLLQTKPQVKSMYINYYNLYYNIIKNRDEKEVEAIHAYDILIDDFPMLNFIHSREEPILSLSREK